MEVLPYCYLLLNELMPLLMKLGIVVIMYGFVVGSGAYHVKQGGYCVERVADFKNALLTIELSLSVSLRVVSFHNHNPLVNKTLSL